MATDIQKVSILHKDSIHCGFHLVPYIVDTVLRTLSSSTYVLITDTHVAALHLTKFEDEFRKNPSPGKRFLTYVIQPGETSKSREGKAEIEDFLLGQACTRDTVILALGGGVIGDLVGFVAATFMRGVRFVQIPTTLLAMVDSSVGGKTAIDTPHGKNLIGAFWQPEYVFIDAAFLETLPAREFSNGMAEIVKTAAIWNQEDFVLLESRSQEIFDAIQTPSQNFAGRQQGTRSESQALLLRVIVGSISVKAHIVTVDERETGLRNLVNFGHTIGHAIEAVLTPTILHGECVSIGSILEAEVSRQLGHLGQVAVGRLSRVLKAYNLPISLKDPRIITVPASQSLSVDRLLDIMKIDKKNSGSMKKIVLLARIGKTVEEKASAVADDVIRRTLSDAVRVIPGIPRHVSMATPGSKSISNRALVLASLGEGTCRLKNLLHSEDTQVMMAALGDLRGAQFFWEDNGETLVVKGGKGDFRTPQDGKSIYLANAGTAARFLTCVCTLVKSNSSSLTTTITGNARMKERPIGPLVDALRANGSPINYLESEGCLPLSIGATQTGLTGGHIKLAASVSSQFVSAVLLCAPYAAEDVVLELIGGQVISQSYIDMTIAMMQAFGVLVRRDKGTNVYRITRGYYRNPSEYAIESDASSATYPLAIAAITGTTCTIQNIGKNSLQGDARFAKEVLEPMGCQVVQTDTETTVTGPAVQVGLLAGGVINMEPMTDAFLTASVLAAVATRPALEGRRPGVKGGKETTRIVGISNQRVKECNRIKAMADELAKFGVKTFELDDGLEVHGQDATKLKNGVSVRCYDDHRVAMAFSVLATRIGGTVLEEKRCVEKTWPNWWDDLQNKIGISVEGVELQKSSDAIPLPRHHPSTTIFLIGMRGAGKSYVGKLAAAALDRKFLDADMVFERKHSIGVREFVTSHGWPAFRLAETQILRELLEEKAEDYVISLGGGIVETPEARDLLKTHARDHGPVVHVARDVNEIAQYLWNETSRPNYGEPVVDVFLRREPWFQDCSTHEYINYFRSISQQSPWDHSPSTRESIQIFFRHITGTSPNLCSNINSGQRSYFLSLTYPSLIPALSDLDELSEGCDAIEIRVDLLSPNGLSPRTPNIPHPPYVASQVAAVRLHSPLPIIYTVRTTSQGGMFPDDGETAAFDLMMLGLRLGCEYIDVEISWSEKRRRALNAVKGYSQVISSWHDWSGKMKWNSGYLKERYTTAADLGDIVKIVGKADKMEDNFTLRQFVASVSGPRSKPFIAINMGAEGQISRILNTTLSPVTHPMMLNKAAPGQLPVAQIQTGLHVLGQLQAKKFYLFGTPICQSMSPTLHNSGFKALGLPHSYELMETSVVGAEVQSILTSPDFGGASVTTPFKLDILTLLDNVSSEALKIGAVNTIIVRLKQDGSRELLGDNTDWIGIVQCVRDNLGDKHPRNSKALVIGAGGASRAALYALHVLDVSTIYLFNRTRSSAEKLVSQFGPDYNITIIDAVDQFNNGPPSIIISTVPCSAMSLEQSEKHIVLSRGVLSAGEGVVVDMAYQPGLTPLITLAKSVKEGQWRTVEGVGVLLEQGYRQFEAWTDMRAPRSAIRRMVHERYQGE